MKLKKTILFKSHSNEESKQSEKIDLNQLIIDMPEQGLLSGLKIPLPISLSPSKRRSQTKNLLNQNYRRSELIFEKYQFNQQISTLLNLNQQVSLAIVDEEQIYF